MKKTWWGLIVFLVLWHAYVLLPLLFNDSTADIGRIIINGHNNQIIAEIPKKNGFAIPYAKTESIPPSVKNAFLYIEDQRFFSHLGVDVLAKIRALWLNFTRGEIVSGGSTITEQYIKNQYFKTHRRTYLQKLREAHLAMLFSIVYTKEDILKNYLNTVYFGKKNYGIKSAIQVFFGKSHLETLSSSETALLIALLRSPGTQSLKEKSFFKTYKRVYKNLFHEDIDTLPPVNFRSFTETNKLPHVTSSVRQYLRRKQHLSQFDFITVQTSIHVPLQIAVKNIIHKHLQSLQGNNVSNAAVYMRHPETGQILVWQGSKDFFDSTIEGQVNVLLRPRQQGSTLKPFIYLLAYMRGIHPDTLILDEEKDFYSEETEGKLYRPLNYNLNSGGVLTLQQALAGSYNNAAVRLTEFLGLKTVYDFFQELQLELPYSVEHYGYSLSLGSPDIPMQKMVDAYAALANNGNLVEAQLIQGLNLQNQGGKSHKNIVFKPQHRALFRNQEIPLWYLKETLSNPLHRRTSFGYNSQLNTTLSMAVKTGTTSHWRDNWTYSFHPDIAVGVWVGNNDNTSMVDVDGITGAGPIWHDIIEYLYEHKIINGHTSSVEEARKYGLYPYKRCLKKDCTIFQSSWAHKPAPKWKTSFQEKTFCWEDFIAPDEAAAFRYQQVQDGSMSFSWCTQPENSQAFVVRPEDQQVFILRSGIPRSLQKITFEASHAGDWMLNGKAIGNFQKELLELSPGDYRLTYNLDNTEFSRQFSVKFQEK